MSNSTKSKALNEKETTGTPKKDGKKGYDDTKEFTAEDFDKINADNGFITIKFADEGTFVCTHLSKEVIPDALFTVLSKLADSFGFSLLPCPKSELDEMLRDLMEQDEEDDYYDDSFHGHSSYKPEPS